ncbi:MAG: hypothetical protein ABJF23_00660 [Bryobacteraceae bacterium]
MFLSVVFSFLAAAASLPPAVTSELDSRHSGWKLAPAAPQIQNWFAEYRFRFAPNLVTGDFDGDGKTDYVLQIQTKQGQQVMIAFLDRSGKFETHVLATDTPDPFRFLLRMDKGSKDFDFTTLKPFRHPVDAVDLMYFDKTPLTFLYRKGVFRKMLSPSDEEIEK